MTPPKPNRSKLMASYQKGKTYSFIVTDELNNSGCQIVQDANGVKHLLTGTTKKYPSGRSVKLEVRGFSHTPSQLTGCHYLVLSPKSNPEPKNKVQPFNGKTLIPRKTKISGFNASFLKKYYAVGKRYLFVVVEGRDNKGRQFVEDSFGIKHILTGTNTIYEIGENVRCTVIGISKEKNDITQNYFMTLTMPRCTKRENLPIKYEKSPQQWHHEVQGLDKHQCRKPFTCACCGQDFPGRMGYRVEIKDIYFCKSCASKIFVPEKAKKGPVIIYTPMGNKR